jgi:hypothetical protein
MKLVVAPEAAAQIVVRKQWWRANRSKAPERFDAELAVALVNIVERPQSFPIFSALGERIVRRCLLVKTRCHLYVRACRQPWLSYFTWHVGIGLDAELLCKPCADGRGNGSDVEVAPICEQCFTDATSEVCDLVGVRGRPGILERSETATTDSCCGESRRPTGRPPSADDRSRSSRPDLLGVRDQHVLECRLDVPPVPRSIVGWPENAPCARQSAGPGTGCRNAACRAFRGGRWPMPVLPD